jgi:hypothetical protein
LAPQEGFCSMGLVCSLPRSLLLYRHEIVSYWPFFILEYHKVMSLVVSTGVHVLIVWFDTTPLALNSYINSFP